MSADVPFRGFRLVAVGLSVLGMVLCCPDYDIWWLGFLAWVPYFAAIEGVKPRRALLFGWLVGTFTVFWGFFWLTTLLEKFAGFSVLAATPIAALFAAWHGLIWGFAAMLMAWLRRRAPTVPLWVTAPLCWVTLEATLPNIFPIYMAHGWSWQPLWIQAAEIGGVTTVSAIMVAINAGIYEVLQSWRSGAGFDRRSAAFTVALLVIVPTYGAIRMAQVDAEIEAAPKVKFGVVQGNMSIHGMRGNRHRVLRGQQKVSAELQAQGAEIVLWGETAYPNHRVFTRGRKKEPRVGHPWRVHQGFTIPAIIGTVTRSKDSPYPYNTALLIDEDGEIKGSYDKVYRLIFGEYIPLVPPQWYLKQIPAASHLEKGDGPGMLQYGEYRFGPLICYEDILPRFVRSTANNGVNAFVNLTNDAWFGKTHEPPQHLGLAVFRSIEHRRPLVRAVNTGVSTYLDPAGRALHKTRVTDPDIEGWQDSEGFVVDVPMIDKESKTIYGVTGELFNGLCVLGVVVIAWRYRSPSDDPSSTPSPPPSDVEAHQEPDIADAGAANFDADAEGRDPTPEDADRDQRS